MCKYGVLQVRVQFLILVLAQAQDELKELTPDTLYSYSPKFIFRETETRRRHGGKFASESQRSQCESIQPSTRTLAKGRHHANGSIVEFCVTPRFFSLGKTSVLLFDVLALMLPAQARESEAQSHRAISALQGAKLIP